MAARNYNETLARAQHALDTHIDPNHAPFPAAITPSQVRALEDHAASNDIGSMRRMVLITMASDSAALMAVKAEAPDTFTAMIDSALDYMTHADAASKLAKSALARLALIGLADG